MAVINIPKNSQNTPKITGQKFQNLETSGNLKKCQDFFVCKILDFFNGGKISFKLKKKEEISKIQRKCY